MKKNLLVAFGGVSVEHDISIITALQIYKKISKEYNIIFAYIDKKGNWLSSKKFDMVKTFQNLDNKNFRPRKIRFGCNGFVWIGRKKVKIFCCVNCCHGGLGENGGVASLMELLKIPYTSSNPNSSQITMDKTLTKFVLKQSGICVCDFAIVNNNLDAKQQKKSISHLEFPLILKPANLGSSVGIEVANNVEEFRKFLKYAFLFDMKVIVEKFLKGAREFNCACFKKGNDVVVSNVQEVEKDEIFSFDDKYIKTSNCKSKKISFKLKKQIQALAEKAYLACDCFGVVRIDFLYKDGVLYVNELNSVPGGLSMYLFRQKFGEILQVVIDEAVKRCESSLLELDFKSEALSSFAKVEKSFGFKK